MSKIGRNDPCPCGSGKKYKRCHGTSGGSLQPENAGLPGAKSLSVTFMGLPAQAEHLHVINRFKDGDPRNEIPLQGTEGDYKVTFDLTRPGYNLLPEGNLSFATGLRGDSHLAISKPAFAPPGNPDADQILIMGRTEDGEFRFSGNPNSRGFLGKMESHPLEQGTGQMRAHGYLALASSLSNWSVHLDVPLEIYQVDTVEVITGTTQMSLVTPYWEAPFAVAPVIELEAEFRGYASLYREGLGSSSNVYRFLCWYKIIEGIRSRRARLAEEARKAGKTVSTYREVLPTRPEEISVWLDAIFPVRRKWDAMALESAVPPEVRGKRFGYVVSEVLQPLRVNIAHALSAKSGELTMSADELLHVQNVSKWLLPTKCIVRRILKNEFPTEFLSYVREDGTFEP